MSSEIAFTIADGKIIISSLTEKILLTEIEAKRCLAGLIEMAGKKGKSTYKVRVCRGLEIANFQNYLNFEFPRKIYPMQKAGELEPFMTNLSASIKETFGEAVKPAARCH